MKKFLAVLCGVIFLLSFTVTAFAIHEETPPSEAVVSQGAAKITLGGKIIVRGWFFDEVDGAAMPTASQSQALYTTNVYLTVDAKINDNVRGYLELESSNNDGNNSGVAYWGVGKPGSPAVGTYDTKPNADLRFRQAWVMYTGSGLLGVPAGIKVGHMPIALGEKIFLNNERFGDDAILVWVDPTKEMHLLIGDAKLVDSNKVSIGSIDSHQDLDAYVVMGTYNWDKDNVVGLNWAWAHSTHDIPSLAYDAAGNFIPVTDSLNFHNFGIHASGKISGLSYGFEGDIQTGKAENVVLQDGTELGTLHFQGWALFAKAGYALDMLNIRASVAMGSGDNGRDANSIKEFQAMQGTDQTGAIARFVHYTMIYERLVRTAAAEALLTTNPGGNVRSTGIANTTYANVGFDVNPTKELSISVDGYILQATKTGAWENIVGGRVSRDLGQEVDLKLNYQIAKNLSYFVEGGAFFPGKFYDNVGSTVDDNFTGRKTTTMAVHGLLLQF